MRRKLTSIVAATVLLGLSVQVVSADTIVPDGEGLEPIAGGRMDLGTICHAAPTADTALIAVRATGHPNGRQVFDNGATVTTTATILQGAGLTATSAAPAVVMAADWRSQPNGTFSAPVAWDVSVTPDALGRFRGRLEFTATGLNRHGQTITRSARMNVIARVVDCAPPALDGMPADVVLEAVAPDGADLLYVPPTATDAIDDSVAAVCDVPSSSRVPIGVTTITCSATDRAGNVASGTFTVSVVDTTAPTLDGMPRGIAVTALDVGGASVDWPMPTASDAVDGALTVTCEPSPASLFAVGSTTVTCSATDAAGNVASASFDLVVSASPDPDPLPEQTPSGPFPGTVDDDEPRQDSGGGPSAAAQGSVPGVLPDTSMPATSAAAPVLGVLLVALVAVSAVLRRRPA